MGTAPFAASVKLPKSAGARASNDTSHKLPITVGAKLQKLRLSTAERLWRLEEAKAFLRQEPVVDPPPTSIVLKATSVDKFSDALLGLWHLRALHRWSVAFT